jgi:hypothetical protein
MKRSYSLRLNKDGTITFRSGTYIEHFEMQGLTETYDRVKYAAVCADISLNEATLERDLKELLGKRSDGGSEGTFRGRTG